MKHIELTQGKRTAVSNTYYERLNQWKWHYKPSRTGKTGYAARRSSKAEGGGIIKMHNVILPPPISMEVDHIDGNGLNNQTSKLRIGTHQQNSMNRRLPSTNKSGFKGVSWDKYTNKWKAYIKIDGKCHTLGRFTCLIQAAKRYDKVAKEFFGEFARTNFPMPIPPLPEKE